MMDLGIGSEFTQQVLRSITEEQIKSAESLFKTRLANATEVANRFEQAVDEKGILKALRECGQGGLEAIYDKEQFEGLLYGLSNRDDAYSKAVFLLSQGDYYRELTEMARADSYSASYDWEHKASCAMRGSRMMHAIQHGLNLDVLPRREL